MLLVTFLLSFIKKHFITLLLVILSISFIGYKSIQNYHLQSTVDKLEAEKIQLQQKQEIAKQKAINDINLITSKYNFQAQQREKEYAKEIQNLHRSSSDTSTKLNSLYVTTDTIKHNVYSPNTSRETIIRYVDKYQTVFNECTGELTKVAEDADRLVIENNKLNDEINSIYDLLEDYRLKNPTISD